MAKKRLPGSIIIPERKSNAGRKSINGVSLKEIDLREIELLAIADMTKTDIALHMGITIDYLNKLSKVYPEIDEAYHLGRSKKKKRVLEKLDDKIESGDMKAIQLWLERRGGDEWKDNKVITNLNVTVSKEHRLAAIEAARQGTVVDGDYTDITPEEWNS